MKFDNIYFDTIVGEVILWHNENGMETFSIVAKVNKENASPIGESSELSEKPGRYTEMGDDPFLPIGWDDDNEDGLDF